MATTNRVQRRPGRSLADSGAVAVETLTHTLRDAITLSEAREYIPRRPHVATIWRWATSGTRGVVLQTAIVGGRRMTTPAMIETFLLRLNADAPVSEQIGDADLARRAAETTQALAALGVK